MRSRKSLKKKIKNVYSKYDRKGPEEDVKRKASNLHKRYSGMRIVLDEETFKAIQNLKHIAKETDNLEEDKIKEHINRLS